jgi:hypothetical protein
MSQIGVWAVGCRASALISVSFSSFGIWLGAPRVNAAYGAHCEA